MIYIKSQWSNVLSEQKRTKNKEYKNVGYQNIILTFINRITLLYFTHLIKQISYSEVDTSRMRNCQFHTK